ncbi:hypothetical protein P879_02931 [Paragonimus westermani]|uniref:Uncharacterized protein n=1 Tax=Paragonimus westermani TaxID=34504 RepID=A0A8T0DQE2_9TREM|nr:hypothetical protein P879_02931 [Paragonimus westermani]
MSIKDDLSPPCVKSACAQPTIVDDRGEFRPSLRQSYVLHSDDNFESSEFAVIIYLAGVPVKSIKPYILSFLSEDAVNVFRMTSVRSTEPALVIGETLRQLFEKQELPAPYGEEFFTRRQTLGGLVDCSLRDLREVASRIFEHLAPVDCERFCMGLRNQDLRNRFILKPAENLSVAPIKAMGYDVLERLDEKRAAED